MKLTRSAILTLAVFAAFGVAHSESDFLDVISTHYKLGDESALTEKSCGMCHVSDSDYTTNPYGKDLALEMTSQGATMLTAAILQKLEPLDSDGDGTTNGEEIAADTLPGDATSGAAPGAAPATQPAPAEAKPKQFPPKNGYHPAIVHFPIGLFLAGLLLDFIGMVKNQKALLLAGWYNLVLAAASTIFAALSGVLAMSLMKLPYKGLIFDHMIYAVGASVIMWLMVALRVHRHEKMNVPIRVLYYALAVAGLITISYAGHLGGVFVYGE